MIALHIYYWLTRLGAPFLRLHLLWRMARGKEDRRRLAERMGCTSALRPKDTLWWLHAASVGEAVSLLKLMDTLHAEKPELTLLVTTGTVTSAKLLEEKLPPYALHQFVPIDVPQWMARFLDHWRPELAIFTESELWPNMILESEQRGIRLALINARMSEKSFDHWKLMPQMIAKILQPFALIAAQSADSAERYKALGACNVIEIGNLKHDAEALVADQNILHDWQKILVARPCIVAASLHPAEEEVVMDAFISLQESLPKLALIIVPRHPQRAAAMAESAKERRLTYQLRSAVPSLRTDTKIYIADTIGEMGLWYRLADVVVMGGSFIMHGGQNPLEPARLGKPIIAGPHMFHFQEIAEEMSKAEALTWLPDAEAETLACNLHSLLCDEPKRNTLAANAEAWLNSKPPVAQRVAEALINISKERA